MKKKVISSITLMIIAFMLGLVNYVGATNQNIEDGNITVENEIVNKTDGENNTQWYGTNSTPKDFVNDINNQLQNVNSAQPSDNRKSVIVTIIVIITVALIAVLVTWYYMTNQ